MSEAALAGENGCGRTTHRARRLRLSNFDLGIPPDTRKALDKILKEHGVVVNHVMEFDNVETVKHVVEIDAGISIVPESNAIQEIDKKTLVSVKIEDGEFFRPIAAIYKKNRVLSPAMKQFMAILKSAA